MAGLLGASPVTVSKWAHKGLLHAHVTQGGHRRFTYTEIQRLARDRGMTLFLESDAPLRILIVEDDKQFSDFLNEALSGDGFDLEVIVANDGFEAGRQLQKSLPQIALLDIMLPGIDGFTVCKQLRTDPETQEIRVIAMTGYYTKENVDRILQAGAETCLEKPFTTSQVFDALNLAGVEGAQPSDSAGGRRNK
ncbi:MAG: response regulator [Candidatus Thiodiazotropha sp. (ex Gloverina cf. vestifex)]|nr:response regulator [Candidatus Thiodiazotropha sp. (ex Gloverina cf. vestifex)]